MKSVARSYFIIQNSNPATTTAPPTATGTTQAGRSLLHSGSASLGGKSIVAQVLVTELGDVRDLAGVDLGVASLDLGDGIAVGHGLAKHPGIVPPVWGEENSVPGALGGC